MTLLLGLALQQAPLPGLGIKTAELEFCSQSTKGKAGREPTLNKVSPKLNLSYFWKWGSFEVYHLVSGPGSLLLTLATGRGRGTNTQTGPSIPFRGSDPAVDRSGLK